MGQSSRSVDAGAALAAGPSSVAAPAPPRGTAAAIWRGAVVGLPSVALFWAYLGVASLIDKQLGYLLSVPVAIAIAIGGVLLAARVGLTQRWLVAFGTPTMIAIAALVGTLAGGGLNDAGGAWREALGWALVALLAYPAVAVIGESPRTPARVVAVASVGLAYALMLGYVRYSLPGWRVNYYLRYGVPMVAVEVPGFELASARAYDAELVVWLRGRAGHGYAGNYLRAEVHMGVLARPSCGDAEAKSVVKDRWVCPSGLILGKGSRNWFRLAEPNGTRIFKDVVEVIAKGSDMRAVTLDELKVLPIASY